MKNRGNKAASVSARGRRGLRWVTLDHGPGGVVVRLLASHLGEPRSIPDFGFLYVGIVPDDVAGRRVFSGISRFPRPSVQRCSILTSLYLIGSQDLDDAESVLYLRVRRVRFQIFHPISKRQSDIGVSILPQSFSSLSLIIGQRRRIAKLLADSFDNPTVELRFGRVLTRSGKSMSEEGTAPECRDGASSGTIPTCENSGLTLPGIEPGSFWWEVRSPFRIAPMKKLPSQRKASHIIDENKGLKWPGGSFDVRSLIGCARLLELRAANIFPLDGTLCSSPSAIGFQLPPRRSPEMRNYMRPHVGRRAVPDERSRRVSCVGGSRREITKCYKGGDADPFANRWCPRIFQSLRDSGSYWRFLQSEAKTYFFEWRREGGESQTFCDLTHAHHRYSLQLTSYKQQPAATLFRLREMKRLKKGMEGEDVCTSHMPFGVPDAPFTLPLPTLPNPVTPKTRGYNAAPLRCTGMQRRGKRDILEKINLPAASYGTIPTCENPGAVRLGGKRAL
ncbi:hypothetical protein PR048_008072 [Dryococelus australis]|uniref:Uncharacterized protein n=1 Tax=Dryococelus australis TaxID=614101 RepID=A0ABQ9HWY1_9NEOP|nr:hypothetical protein PR048_008072 [Dryococelus australis]